MTRRIVSLAAAWIAVAIPGTAQASVPGAPYKPGTLYADLIAEPDNLCNITSTSSSATDCMNLVFNSLNMVNSNVDELPDLSTEVATLANGGISKDGLTYTFHLKKGLKFHDGHPLTSADVKFSYEANRDFAAYREPFEKIAEIRTPDDYTVIVKAKEVWAALPEDLQGTIILPKHLLKDLKTKEDWDRSPFLRAPVGSGPFKFEKWESGSFLSFVRNPDYHLGAPKLERIVLVNLPDRNTRVTQLATGELDWYHQIEWPQYQKVRTLPGIKTEEFSTFLYTHLDFNMKKPVFADRKMRYAIAHAIDRQALSDGIFEGKAQVAHTVVHPKVAWAFHADVPKYAHDTARAQQLLDELGWKAGSDGIRTKDGQRLHLTVSHVAESKVVERIVLILQQQLKKAGIELEARGFPGSMLFDLDTTKGILNGGNYELAIFSWALSRDPGGQANIWKSDRTPPQGQNATFYVNKDLDKIWDDAMRTFDKKKRGALYRKAQEILMTDLPTIPLYYRPDVIGYKEQLQGVLWHPVGNIGHYWNSWMWNWRPAAAP